jgi:hypothetical protein
MLSSCQYNHIHNSVHADCYRTPHQHLLPPSSAPSSSYAKTLASYPPLIDPSIQSQIPYPPFLPSAGLTRRYLSSLQDVKAEHGVLLAWCVEGDNRDDARALAAATLMILGQGELTYPVRSNWSLADQTRDRAERAKSLGRLVWRQRRMERRCRIRF